MKDLRLLLFSDCNRSCPDCCNKQYDLVNLPVETDYSRYKLIILTGGEPLLKPSIVLDTIKEIRATSKAKIIVYTAKLDCISNALLILEAADGLTVTLHNQEDVTPWFDFACAVAHIGVQHKSLRVNIFEGIDAPEYDDWVSKREFKYLEECPVPENEVFRRLR